MNIEKYLLIGTIAAFRDMKGYEILLKSIKIIKKHNTKVKFILIGDGEDWEKIKKMAKETEIYDDIIFTGYREDIPKILASLDIFVLPSLGEGVPQVILQAMAMKKPVVATNVGGIPEVICNDETGYLVPPNNSTELAEKILHLITERRKRVKFGEEGRKLVEEKFSLNKMIKELDKIYKEVYYGKQN